MDGKKRGLNTAMKPEVSGSLRSDTVSGIPAAVLLQLGTALVIGRWFPGCGAAWWLLLAGMLALSCLQWLLHGTKAGKWTVPAGLALAAAFCLVGWKQVIPGFGCLGNDVLRQMTRVYGTIQLDFAAAEGSGLWAVIPACTVVTLLLNQGVLEGRLLPVLPEMAAVYAGVVTGLYPVDAGAGLLGVGMVLLLLRKTGPRGWAGKPAWAGVLVLCTLMAAAVGLSAGEEEPRDPGAVIRSAVHDTFLHEETNSMPEGNLKNLRDWKKNNSPALEITMSQPQKLYLRGRVYESYTGTAWEGVDPELLTQREDLFFWLHEADFYGQSQIGAASSLAQDGIPQSLTVRTLGACGETGYYPYALLGSETLEADRIGDAGFPEAETLTYLTGSVPQWYDVQQALADRQEDTAVAAYLLAEEAYEAYVTEADLQLTNESWSVLKRQLGDGEGTLSQIRTFIRDYLEENLIYDEEAKTLNGGGDFLQYTLEKSGSGYSVHYATAATLMLRYFGVPARYVEGYFLSAAEAEQYAAGQTILLTQEHAHAWAEYYLPGVGFVPFEVTPGYIDDEEAELGGTLAQSDRTYSGNHLQYAQVEQPERIEEREQDRFRFAFKPVYLLWLGLAALLILLLLILRKRKHLKEALDAMREAPNREAIALYYGYAMKLLSNCQGFRPQGGEAAAELNREALFSNHRMTPEQRRVMEEFSEHVLQGCRDTWSWRQKLRYRLWECLY